MVFFCKIRRQVIVYCSFLLGNSDIMYEKWNGFVTWMRYASNSAKYDNLLKDHGIDRGNGDNHCQEIMILMLFVSHALDVAYMILYDAKLRVMWTDTRTLASISLPPQINGSWTCATSVFVDRSNETVATTRCSRRHLYLFIAGLICQPQRSFHPTEWCVLLQEVLICFVSLFQVCIYC